MRLVDADALQQHFTDMQHYERCACHFVDDGGFPATEWYCVEDALENAPTIDAIPVEWLRNICAIAKMETDDEMFLEWLIQTWQKEQEGERWLSFRK